MTAIDGREKPELKGPDIHTFGAYGSAASYNALLGLKEASPDIQAAKPIYRSTQISPESNTSILDGGALTPEKKYIPWFREIGITSDPIEMKRIWSPRFEHHYATRKWSETYQGRLAMRAVSRFVVGTAMYAAAGIYSREKLEGYNTSDPPKGVLQHVARVIDNTIGKAIQGAVGLTGNKILAKNSVRFRKLSDFGYKDGNGRNLGHEVVGVTFDFAAMSFGDYMTRYFIGIFDPHTKTKWIKYDEEGKHGHLDLAGGLRETGRNVFKAVTYAAGEDMAVAVPYVYTLSYIRQSLDKLNPGSGVEAENKIAGGAIKVDHKGHVVGSHQLQGIIYFTAAFSLYNVGTKIFRDLYAKVSETLYDWKHGYTETELAEKKARHSSQQTFIDRINNSIKYLAVTFTKMMFIMLPSAFMFGILRIAPDRLNGLAINTEGKITGHIKDYIKTPTDAFSNKIYHNPKDAPLFNTITNPIGKFVYHMGSGYNNALQVAARRVGVDSQKTEMFARSWANAAVAYTPYFMLKSDVMAPFLDTNRTDFVLGGFFTSLGNLIKATVSLNGKGIKASWRDTQQWSNEVLYAMGKQPSPRYERRIQRMMNDEGYKESNEGYILDQDELIKHGEKVKEIKGEAIEAKRLKNHLIAPELKEQPLQPGYAHTRILPSSSANTSARATRNAHTTWTSYAQREANTRKSLLDRSDVSDEPRSTGRT